MRRLRQIIKLLRRPLWSCAVLIIVYEFLVFVVPANSSIMDAFTLKASQYHILLALITLPYVFIWVAAFIGYAKLQEYSKLICKTNEWRPFLNIQIASAWLAWGLALSAIVALLLNAIVHQIPSMYNLTVIIINYLYLIFTFTAFMYMRAGTQGLMKQIKIKLSLVNSRLILLLFVSLGVLFCYFFFRKLNLQSNMNSNNIYHLPNMVLIATLIIPFLFTWFTGLLAAYEFGLYSKHVKGVFYRQPIQILSAGFVAVICSSVGIEYLRSLIPRTGHFTLTSALVAINIIYLIMGAGFILIIFAAIKLQRIEKV